jgi:hypothetical protein
MCFHLKFLSITVSFSLVFIQSCFSAELSCEPEITRYNTLQLLILEWNAHKHRPVINESAPGIDAILEQSTRFSAPKYYRALESEIAHLRSIGGDALQQAFTAQDSLGDTVMHTVLRLHQYSVIYILFAAGAPVTLSNNTGDTPLHLLVRNGEHVELAQKFIDARASVTAKNINEDTPLHLAFMFSPDHIDHRRNYRRLEMAITLLHNGAEVLADVPNEEGYTPMDLIQYFIDFYRERFPTYNRIFGLAKNVQRILFSYCFNLLNQAIQTSNLSQVIHWLDIGAPIAYVNTYEETPFTYASRVYSELSEDQACDITLEHNSQTIASLLHEWQNLELLRAREHNYGRVAIAVLRRIGASDHSEYDLDITAQELSEILQKKQEDAETQEFADRMVSMRSASMKVHNDR